MLLPYGNTSGSDDDELGLSHVWRDIPNCYGLLLGEGEAPIYATHPNPEQEIISSMEHWRGLVFSPTRDNGRPCTASVYEEGFTICK